MIVTQNPIARHHLRPVLKSFAGKRIKVYVHFVPDGEKAKSNSELFRLYNSLISKDFERRDWLFALGGGVVGDLTGFAAATYLRGVPFVNAGTTLLAQVDSSIGGKTGINLDEGKNLIGAFYPPKLVISDLEALRTLPHREFKASLAEVVKYGIIRSPQLFRLLEKEVKRVLAKDISVLLPVVALCARIKAGVVSRDERETKGERIILNYGHTFGHAFEQALGFKTFVHGEAVSVGMVCAAALAVRLNLCSQGAARRQFALLRALGLPVSLAGLNLHTNAILSAMARDKKKKAGKLRFVLPEKIGRVVIREDIALAEVRKVIQESGGKS
jgi:3-dehydroquinate synthase